jgi:hypothetical protein
MRSLMCLFLLLAACDGGPPVPTAAENRDLDEAGDLLDGAENNLAAIGDRGLDPVGNSAP